MSVIGGWIHPAYLRTLLRRSVIVWAFARLTLTGLGAAARAPVTTLSPLVAIMLLAALALLAQVDARAMRESLFHANLGTPRFAPALVSVGTAGTIELLITTVAAAWT